MLNRARLRRDLGWGAAAIVLLSVTTDRSLLFERHLFHVRRRARHRADRRSAPVRMGGRQGAYVVYPRDADSMRCAQPGRARHLRRFWDARLPSDEGIEPGSRGLDEPVSPASGGRGRKLASTSTSTSTSASASEEGTWWWLV
jgi:hypothetical protein